MCGAGDAVKIVTFVLNCQLFRTKVQLFTQSSLPRACPSNNKQQKQNHCPPYQPWRRSFWPNTITNQQSGGTSLTSKMIANSPYDSITVDCYLAAFFLNLVKLAHHGHVDHGNCNFEMAVQAIQLRLLG
jgi:hypothetical protein